ncbi:MAG: hypothetical protein Kow0065_24030 [Methylomicrobium sp.]
MHEQEGVIKFRFDHRHVPLDDNVSLSGLNAWRSVLFKLGLIGRDPARYGGLGYGNISIKPDPDDTAFIVSGTQTGHLEKLTREHYCRVLDVDLTHHALISEGLSQPSSEAITHACVYRHDRSIGSVIHVHCPEIWRHTQRLGLAFTSEEIAYGTHEMVLAVDDLFESERLKRNPIFSMLGHRDGIVAFGQSVDQAAGLVIRTFSEALAIDEPLE